MLNIEHRMHSLKRLDKG